MNIDTILLLYNRPQHTLAVLESIKNNGIEQIFAYLDFSDSPEVIRNQDEMKKTINDFEGCIINLIERKEKLGLARSVRSALDTSFQNGADAVILLEDDCVLRSGGKDFFLKGLQELESNKKIRSLCGYLFPNCNFVFDPEGDTLLLNRFSTWGWATWKDRWQQYEPVLSKFVSYFDNIGLPISDFAPDLDILCRSEKYLTNKVDIWSISWILLHYLSSTYAVYPKESVIENIGLDGSGSNCEVTDVFNPSFANNVSNSYNWKNLTYFLENEIIIRDFMAVNGLKTYPSPYN